MARIILELTADDSDLSDSFVRALSLLKQSGVKLHPGTKLVSKYAVIIVEDPVNVVERLRGEKIGAYIEGSSSK